MATKAKAKAAKAGEIRIPKKFPAIKGMTPKAVRSLYIAEREAGLGHVRVMTRLAKRAAGKEVPALATLGRFTAPARTAAA